MVRKIKGYILCDMCGSATQFVTVCGDEYLIQCARCGHKKKYDKYSFALKVAQRLDARGYNTPALKTFNLAERMFKLFETDDNSADNINAFVCDTSK